MRWNIRHSEQSFHVDRQTFNASDGQKEVAKKLFLSDSSPGSLKFSRLVGRRVILSMRNQSFFVSQTLIHELSQIHVNYFAHIHSISLQVARTHQNSEKRRKNRNTCAAAAHSPLCLIINTWYRFRKKNSQHWHSVCSLVGCCFSGQTFSFFRMCGYESFSLSFRERWALRWWGEERKDFLLSIHDAHLLFSKLSPLGYLYVTTDVVPERTLFPEAEWNSTESFLEVNSVLLEIFLLNFCAQAHNLQPARKKHFGFGGDLPDE